MQMIAILTPNDPLIFSFRKYIICNQFNESEKFLYEDIKYSTSINEEVWKFSKKKWESINFKEIAALIINNNVVAISGAKYYNDFLRVGMNYYILPEYRKIARSILWNPQGFIDTHISDKLNLSGYFISIYPHNNKLKKWVDSLANKTNFGQLCNTSALTKLNLLNISKNPIKFNGVSQYILYYMFDKNIKEYTLLKMLEDKQ